MSHASPSCRGVSLVSLQLLICALAGAFFGFAPPASGEILLIPLNRAGAGELVPAAVAQGARLIGRGPVAGSMIVYGDGRRLARTLIGDGVIALSARATGCGSRA